MSAPRALVLRAAGSNCDLETSAALELAGARPERVHVNRLLEGEDLARALDGYDLLAIPGGFTYGDDLGAGRILGGILTRGLGDAISALVERGGLVLGVCNGFQVLVRAGLLPGEGLSATLTDNRSGRFDDGLERYVEVPSDTLPFEQRPWMKAAEITDRLVTELASGRYRHARANYANGDMVGHTGHFEASIQAVEAVDLQLGRLLPLIREQRGALIVTADHGNADEMFEVDAAGEPKRDAEGRTRVRTSHTLNPVPLHVYAPGAALELAGHGLSAQIAGQDEGHHDQNCQRERQQPDPVAIAHDCLLRLHAMIHPRTAMRWQRADR